MNYDIASITCFRFDP